MSEVGEKAIQQDQKTFPSKNINGNIELLLYSYHHCFYSQKVLMVLYEKKISFATKLVDITKGEQYHLWFLKINPKGQVPVLKDGIKYFPGSGRIINYLEDNFSNGEHSRLIPIDKGPEIRQKVLQFQEKIDSIEVNVITFGALVNNEFCSNLRYPFVIPFIQKILKEKTGSKTVRELAAKLPDYQETFLEKADYQDKIRALISDKNSFFKVLQEVDELLEDIEEELSKYTESQSDWWLCTDRFTVADISLTLLLDRLSRVGLENHFWGKEKRPHVARYYQRAQKRESYIKTIPTFLTDLSIILRTRAPLILGVGFFTVLTVVVGGFFYFKRQ